MLLDTPFFLGQSAKGAGKVESAGPAQHGPQRFGAAGQGSLNLRLFIVRRTVGGRAHIGYADQYSSQ
jgi:hypothetical protein